MTDYKQLCAELHAALEKHDLSLADDRLLDRSAAALRAALAEPEPKGPTDEELLKLTQDWPCTTGERHDLSGCPEVPLFSVFEDELIDFARAVLARWGK